MASRPGHGHTLPGFSSCVRILLPPSFVVRPIARVTGNPVQGAPPSWTCPRKTLRELQERRRCHRHCRQCVCSFSACPLLAGASADRPRPSPAAPALLFLVLTPPSLPESCPATSNPPGNPGLPQCPGGRSFLAGLSPGRGWGRRRARGAGEGRRRVGRVRPRRAWGRWWAPRRPDRSPCGGEGVPTRRPPKLRSSPPSRGLRGAAWARVCSASPSPPPQPAWADSHLPRAPSPCRHSRRPPTSPAGFVHAGRAALQLTSPGRGVPRPIGRVRPRAQKAAARIPAGLLDRLRRPCRCG